MMKSRSCQHQPIDQSNCHAYVDSVLDGAQHPTRSRTVYVEFVVYPSKAGRYYIRLAVNAEADVANDRFIEDLINRLPIISAPRRQPFQCCAISLSETGH